MGDILIPNVPDETIAVFKLKAEINGRSLNDEFNDELLDLLERCKEAEKKVELSKPDEDGLL